MEEKIYFQSEDVFEVISEILGKNGLKETLDEAAEKDDTENSLIITVFNLTEEFAGEKILEKDFILSLGKQLKVSVQTAENIVKDIKDKILPGAEKINMERQKDESETVSPVRLIKDEQKFDYNTGKQIQQNTKNLRETEKIAEKKSKASKNNELEKTLKKSDGYRESIE